MYNHAWCNITTRITTYGELRVSDLHRLLMRMTNAYVMLTYREDYCVGGMTNKNADVRDD